MIAEGMTASSRSLPPISIPDTAALVEPSAVILAVAAQLATPHQRGITVEMVREFVEGIYGDVLHAKRVLSLSNGVIGVLHSAALGVHAIGRGLALATGGLDRHGVKQTDRFLSNRNIDPDSLSPLWVRFVLADRKKVFINLDWTEFDKDDHTMLVASVQTDHGRSTPLMWKTVQKSMLLGQRNNHEDELLQRLRAAIPRTVEVIIVADRGFGDRKLFAFLLEDLQFGYIIRFKANIMVANEKDETKKAGEWLGPKGHLRRLPNARITGEEQRVPLVIVVQDKDMKDIWCIATTEQALTGKAIKTHYGKRFSCEEMFRDIKDIRFGLGLSWTHIRDPHRRDAMFLLAVLAFALLVLLGAAGEQLGMDKQLKTTTKPGRQFSLFRQGLRWFELLPWMSDERARPLMTRFGELLAAHAVFRAPFGTL